MKSRPDEFSEAEVMDFLRLLFPNGLKAPALVAELCPEGWGNSPLHTAFHPSPERAYEEYRRISENLAELTATLARRTGRRHPPASVMTFDEFLADRETQRPEPSWLNPEDEPAELLGLCLWDIFSDNHEVVANDGRVVRLGSFRGSGGTIAEFIETPGPDDGTWRDIDYLRFYMGTWFIAGRTDLSPAYRLIFRRLRVAGADWRYAFPRIQLISFEPPDDSGLGTYDPSEALQREEERRRQREETRRLRQALDRDTRAAKRRARSEEPPATVRAYQTLYGRFPQGWPPDPYTSE